MAAGPDRRRRLARRGRMNKCNRAAAVAGEQVEALRGRRGRRSGAQHVPDREKKKRAERLPTEHLPCTAPGSAGRSGPDGRPRLLTPAPGVSERKDASSRWESAVIGRGGVGAVWAGTAHAAITSAVKNRRSLPRQPSARRSTVPGTNTVVGRNSPPQVTSPPGPSSGGDAVPGVPPPGAAAAAQQRELLQVPRT
ncbi:uncharacterized protein LOC126285186 [Schistocerca gregaria]|uniref:uncharacterized protein LOC126285186 n=1 Tax=Schistocerca gregaria TaxID=7010 RepID=UPI00211F33A7|nr:uncharacterized protein LOC126285186 [Schistocerca gregaria]